MEGEKLRVFNGGSVALIDNNEEFLPLNKDFYLTVVYTKNAYAEEKLDKVEIYKDGKLFGWTYYESGVYEDGVLKWNNDNYPFYVGICYWNQGFYFLSGEVYSIRLYEDSLSEDKIGLNYERTVKYRDSFKND